MIESNLSDVVLSGFKSQSLEIYGRRNLVSSNIFSYSRNIIDRIPTDLTESMNVLKTCHSSPLIRSFLTFATSSVKKSLLMRKINASFFNGDVSLINLFFKAMRVLSINFDIVQPFSKLFLLITLVNVFQSSRVFNILIVTNLRNFN